MANGRGGSRIGGFIRGALAGLVICAIAAVALSLSAPMPERAGMEAEPVAPSGPAAGETDPTTPEPQAATDAATPPAAEPAPADGATPPATAAAPEEGPAPDTIAAPADEDVLLPQATSPEAAGEADPTGESDAFTAPQAPTQ